MDELQRDLCPSIILTVLHGLAWLIAMPSRRTCHTKGDFHFVDVHVGKRLRKRRQRLGMKFHELAAAAGVSFQQLQKYESAQNRVSTSRLHQLARALGPYRLVF